MVGPFERSNINKHRFSFSFSSVYSIILTPVVYKTMNSLTFFFTVTLLISLWSSTIQARPVIMEARKSYSGRATYYDVGLGSCGQTNTNSQMVAALSSSLMKGPNSPYCGRSITINGKSGSVTVKVVDTCPGCGANDVDLSPAAFKKLGALSAGTLPITWSL